MASNTASTKAADKTRDLEIDGLHDKSKDRFVADLLTDGLVPNAELAMQFGKSLLGDLSLTEVWQSLRDRGEDANRGDLAAVERMLHAQAVALNVLFYEMARRAGLNMGQNLPVTEAYMRMALKAQSQSRATVETLSTVKNPVVFARQANINNGGQQQVNNGTVAPSADQPSHARQSGAAPSKLLEESNGERMDTGTQGQAGGADPQLETVGEVDRPAHR